MDRYPRAKFIELHTRLLPIAQFVGFDLTQLDSSMRRKEYLLCVGADEVRTVLFDTGRTRNMVFSHTYSLVAVVGWVHVPGSSARLSYQDARSLVCTALKELS